MVMYNFDMNWEAPSIIIVPKSDGAVISGKKDRLKAFVCSQIKAVQDWYNPDISKSPEELF